ncbi:protein tyrosine phosphatase [Pseudomonas sp. Lz4W]|uniref:dual specificity protein phosphatase family protein n=1 Tax=Pseudomonas sp. Lz4W TaxID=1206777 RepID=UPI0002BF0E79|nr:dual specificity protein phosphatase family protein [Pseudomonas sp. Lz4W]AUB73437.1 protein tyrosine phosphatase [Pseudomonas sp. Lz4W]
MPKARFLPALCLTLLAAFALPQAQADEATPARPAQWAQPVAVLYNLYQMSPTLYRSALPDGEAQALLENLKIGTVINFLKEPDETWLKTPGVLQVQLPYRTNHVDDADVLAALRAIQTAQARGPVLMHCKHGVDRTGLMAAMYRVVVQDWSKEDALKEMTQGGFGQNSHFEDGAKYMMQADIPQLRTALSKGACSTSPFAACVVKGWLKSA